MLTTARLWSLPLVYDDGEVMRQGASLTIGTAHVTLGAWLGGETGVRGVVLGLHLLNGALFWILSRRWLSDVGALLALTLLWLHPVSLQSIWYLTAGREVWLVTLALLAVLAGVRGGWLGAAIGVGALCLAVQVKASALPLVAAVPLVWAMVQGLPRGVMAGLVGAVLLAGAAWGVTVDGLQLWAAGLLTGLGRIAWPQELALLYDVRGAALDLGWLAVAALAALGVAAWRLGLAAFCAWLWVVGLTLPRAFVADAPPLTDFHLYLPALGLWLASGAGLDALLKGPHGRTDCV